MSAMAAQIPVAWLAVGAAHGFFVVAFSLTPPHARVPADLVAAFVRGSHFARYGIRRKLWLHHPARLRLAAIQQRTDHWPAEKDWACFLFHFVFSRLIELVCLLLNFIDGQQIALAHALQNLLHGG